MKSTRRNDCFGAQLVVSVVLGLAGVGCGDGGPAEPIETQGDMGLSATDGAEVGDTGRLKLPELANSLELRMGAGPILKLVGHRNGGRAAGPSIVCTIFPHDPHLSSHFPWTVNVQANVSCTLPVVAISMTVGLYYQGNLAKQTPWSNQGQAFLSGNAAQFCFNGDWVGAAGVTVTWPPGFNPPTSTGFVVSNHRQISC